MSLEDHLAGWHNHNSVAPALSNPNTKVDFETFVREKIERYFELYRQRAGEYDALDLQHIGNAFANNHQKKLDTNTQMMIGCLLHLTGKCGRGLSATKQGNLPRVDTTDDAFIYAAMASYYRYLADGGEPCQS